ncbi:MAG: cohesin domain-containing protein [Pyrinomonadaceae bacterium]
MKIKKHLAISSLILALLAGSALYMRFTVIGAGDRTVSLAPPPPIYRLTDLGTINTNPQTGQTISHPGGINQPGQVTGYSYSGPNIHAARFTNGLVEDLGTIPGGNISTGVAINDLGHVTGDSQYSENGGAIRHAALFSNGTATDLGTLPGWGNYSRGNGINNAGQVVGHSGIDLDTSNTHAFIWDAAGGMRDLGTLGGQYAKAFSINNSGVVTGDAQTSIPFHAHHAFIWDASGGMRDLGTIAGSYSTGAFINDNGHIAGTSSIANDNRHHAFLYDGTTMRDLGAIGNNDFLSDRSTGKGVNIHDHVVGSTYRPYTGGALTQIAFVYMNGQMYDLEALLDASGDGYRLYTATGINDAGQIAVDALRVGSPNQLRAVLLTPAGVSSPTPTPTATHTPMPTPTACGPTANFANTTFLELPAYSNTHGIADPYPLNVVVSSVQGNITKLTVKLTALYHTASHDVDVLLVGPGGQNAIIMSDAGFVNDAVNLTVTLDDNAQFDLPENGTITNGTYRPTNYGAGDVIPSPAPAPLGGSALSVFNGTNPNGTWSLYAFDDQQIDWGHMNGGFELSIFTGVCGSSTPTPTATPPSLITGIVTYGNAIGEPATPRFVSNVLVSGSGSPNVSTTTGFPDGTYSLSGFGAGSYTVTPSMTGGVNGITSFDAAKIAQHGAGINTLTGSQLLVADVSGNGTISSFDAGQVARYTVSIPGSGSTGNWIFSPASRTYSSVTGSVTKEDYSALLMGEVSGNWTNTGARPFASRQLAVAEGSRSGVAGRDARVPTGIGVGLPWMIGVADKEIVVPLNVQGAADKGIISYEFDLRYDPLVIQPQENPVDVDGTVSRGLFVVTNAEEPGLLRVVMYGALPIDENGVLLNFRFTAVGVTGLVSPLTFERIMFNEGEPRVAVTDGRVTLF